MPDISSKISDLNKAYKQFNVYNKIREAARELRTEISKRMSTRYDIIVELPLFLVQKYSLNPIYRPIRVIKKTEEGLVFNIYLPPMRGRLSEEFLEKYRAEMQRYVPWFVDKHPNFYTSPLGSRDFDVLVTMVLGPLFEKKEHNYLHEYLYGEYVELEKKGLRKKLLLTTGEFFVAYSLSLSQIKIFKIESDLADFIQHALSYDVERKDVLAVVREAGKKGDSSLIEGFIVSREAMRRKERVENLKRRVGVYAWLFTEAEISISAATDDDYIIKRKIYLLNIFSKLFSGPDFLDVNEKADKALIRSIVDSAFSSKIDSPADALRWLFENRGLIDNLKKEGVKGAEKILFGLRQIEQRRENAPRQNNGREKCSGGKKEKGSADDKEHDKSKLRARMDEVWSKELQRKIEDAGADPLSVYAFIEGMKDKGSGGYPTGGKYRRHTNVIKSASGKIGDREEINKAEEFLDKIGALVWHKGEDAVSLALPGDIPEEWREIVFWIKK